MTGFDTPAAHVSEPARKGYVEYEIDVERVLRNELPGVVDATEIAPLTAEAIAAIPEKAKGAYVLFENGHPVYAGKTDTRHGFRDRLSRHSHTIQDRDGFDPGTIGFKAVRILVFSNFDVEAILIKELQKKDATALAWNNSGFGSNDPGRNREGQEPAEFDVRRSINIDRPLPFLLPSEEISVLSLLVRLKEGVSYDFRYETDPNSKGKPGDYRKGQIEQRDAPPVVLPAKHASMREALHVVLSALPSGWQATIFPGRVILYRESKTYAYAREYLAQGA